MPDITATLYKHGTRIMLTIREKEIPANPHVVTMTRVLTVKSSGPKILN